MVQGRVASVHAMPRESFLRTFLRTLRAQCRISFFAKATPETEALRRLRLSRAGAELAEHILEYKPEERAAIVARALELADVPPADLPVNNVFRS